MKKWAYGLLGGTSLIALGSGAAYLAEQQGFDVGDQVFAEAHATVSALTLGSTDMPGLINTLNPVINGITGFVDNVFYTGTVLTTTVLGLALLSRSVNVDQITASAFGSYTCVTPPTLSFQTCTTSACAASTIIAVTPAIAAVGIGYNSGQLTPNTIIASNTYVGFLLTSTAGSTASCTAISINANVIGH